MGHVITGYETLLGSYFCVDFSHGVSRTYPVSAAFYPGFGVFFITPCVSPPHFGGRERVLGGHLLFSVVRFWIRSRGAAGRLQLGKGLGGGKGSLVTPDALRRLPLLGATLNTEGCGTFWDERPAGRVREEPSTLRSWLNPSQGVDGRGYLGIRDER